MAAAGGGGTQRRRELGDRVNTPTLACIGHGNDSHQEEKGTAPASSGSNTLQVVDDGKKPMEQIRAELAAQGILANATTMASFSRATMGELGLTESVKALDTIYGGNLKPAEEMLLAQATSLNAIFCELARRSGLNMGEHLDAADRYMRLSLKAQAQCRATLEALAEIKNPRPVAFVKQANIAHGPQQVNNSAAPGSGISTRTGAHARAEETATQPNELLEAQHGNFLDARAAALQAERIRTWRPWERSTGPRTPEGRATAARNAFKGGHRPILRELSRLVKAEIRVARELVDHL